MELFMRGSGTITFIMVEESCTMHLVIFMRASLLMIWHKDSVFTNMRTAASTSDTGIKISSTDSAKKNGTTAPNIKDSIKMLQKKGKENTAGQMAIGMLVNGPITCSMEKAFSSGMMTGCTLETGKTI